MIGQTISHYRILGELGVGGMGVVYRAEDPRLGREVAIKFLPAEVGDDPAALARFHREARLASSLNHPHICTIHDIGDHHGRPFIVMELLEGRTLRQTMEQKPLPLDQLIELARQVAEAIDAAHRRGIIHRDIKPANVFVTRSGHAKVLDFGLAKLVADLPRRPRRGSSTTVGQGDDDLTAPGIQIGTMAYMAPEQARGEVVDARSDLFSFGTLLYEMATGVRAFAGPTPALVLDGILNRQPLSPRYINPALPGDLEHIIERAMEKDPRLRYQGAADLLADLRRLRRSLDEGRPAVERSTFESSGGRARSASGFRAAAARPWATLGITTFVILILAALGVVYFGARPEALTDRDSILLASFTNATGDPVFDDTLREALAVQLSQSPFLDIVPQERVRETERLMGREPGGPMTHAVAREACQRLSVKAMLEGSIRPLGNLYVLALTATNCQTGASLAAEQAEARTKEDVLRVLGTTSSAIRAKLGESLPSVQKFDVPIERATTSSLEALKAYTLGLSKRAEGEEVESIGFFRRAIELDPEFAAAYTTLSTVYGNLSEWARAEEYARLAYERRDWVSERERLFIAYQFHDRVTGDQLQAIDTLDVWKQSYPRDFTPANSLTLIYNRLGRFERAIEEGLEAVRRNPAHPFPYSNLAYAYRGANRFDDARRTAEQAVARQFETTPTRRLLYQLAVLAGDEEAARTHLEWGRNRPREFDLIGAQAQVAAFEGRMAEARNLYRRTIEMATARGLAELASNYAAHLAWTEAVYGNPTEGAVWARNSLERPSADGPGPGLVRYRAAATLLLAGAVTEADTVVADAIHRYGQATYTKVVLVPVTQALLELQNKAPERAIEALRSASPYEFGTVAAFVPAYVRGQAYLALRSGTDAAAQFRQILDRRGTDPFSPVWPLAHLGLARALALAGDVAASRQAYGDFFSLWAEADPALPVLQQARAEWRALDRRTD